jgi:multicomponent Na+:H+ antiporter subunit B
MNSLILRTAVGILEPVLLLFAVFLLLAGHNEPGGGFVAGLVAAAAFGLHALAHEPADARLLVGTDPRTLIGCGLVLALAAALIPLPLGAPLFTGLWTHLDVPGWPPLALGTPLLFDLGVCVLVAGVALLMILTMAED